MPHSREMQEGKLVDGTTFYIEGEDARRLEQHRDHAYHPHFEELPVIRVRVRLGSPTGNKELITLTVAHVMWTRLLPPRS